MMRRRGPLAAPRRVTTRILAVTAALAPGALGFLGTPVLADIAGSPAAERTIPVAPGTDASISADGRFIAFTSGADDLVPGDTNGLQDVFVRDLLTDSTVRVAVGSNQPAISADGRFVAFSNGDVFIADLGSQAVSRVSTSGGLWPSISADGHLVTFVSTAGAPMLHDRMTGETKQIAQTAQPGQRPYLSQDGRFVTFSAGGLPPGVGNKTCWVQPFAGPPMYADCTDAYVYDVATEELDVVSLSSEETLGNSSSLATGISADGRFVAFTSWATNLVPSYTPAYPVDTSDVGDITYQPIDENELRPKLSQAFVRDRLTGRTMRVSVTSNGEQITVGSASGGVSADGRLVAFTSNADSLGGTRTCGPLPCKDLFVHDLRTGSTEQVSITSEGSPADGSSGGAALSADGRYIAFSSSATNLGLSTGGIILRDNGATVGVGALVVSKFGSVIGASGWASFRGVVATSAVDAVGDAVGQNHLGADLREVSIVDRPSIRDVGVTFALEDLPSRSVDDPRGSVACQRPPLIQQQGHCHTGPEQYGTVSRIPGQPGVVYGLRFESGGVVYEVRTDFNSKVLVRCDVVCVTVAPLAGGYGTRGEEVSVSLPVSMVPSLRSDGISDVLAFTALADPGPAAADVRAHLLDSTELPSTPLPSPTLEVGIAAAGVDDEGEVAFEPVAIDADGRFAWSVAKSTLPDGEYHVWARACHGTSCDVVSSEPFAVAS